MRQNRNGGTMPVLANAALPADLQAELDALGNAEPDTSDIPEIAAEAWRTAQHGTGAHVRVLSTARSIQLESDIAAWLRRQGSNVQAVANRVLRERMNADLATEERSLPKRIKSDHGD